MNNEKCRMLNAECQMKRGLHKRHEGWDEKDHFTEMAVGILLA